MQRPYSEHLKNFLWVVGAAYLFQVLDVIKVINTDIRVKWPLITAACVTFAGFLVVASYFVIWLHWIKRVPEKYWEAAWPAGIPIATGCLAFCGVLLVAGLWSVWSIFTPAVLFVFMMPVIIFLSYL